MTLSALLVFCLTYMLSAATPGPSMAALMARVVARGFQGATAFIAGFVFGDLIWFCFAATGLVFIAKTLGPLFVVVKYIGAAYLLYLAYKIWYAPSEEDELKEANLSESRVKLFFGAMTITLGNPNVIVFFMALLPTVVDLTELSLLGFIELGVAICIVLTFVLTAYALAAAQARALITSARVKGIVNQMTSLVMVGAAMMVAMR